MGCSLGHMLQIDLPSTRLGEPSPVPGGGWSAGAELRALFYFLEVFLSFLHLMLQPVGGLGFAFCVFVTVWRHALRSRWPFRGLGP